MERLSENYRLTDALCFYALVRDAKEKIVDTPENYMEKVTEECECAPSSVSCSKGEERKMLQSLRSNRVRGFTLIEIMVVVLILAILLAIALPAFNKARETTRSKACIKNLREIDDAKDQYTMENKLTTGANVEISDLVSNYLKSMPVCPSGGTYTCNPVGVRPQCSIPGHEL